MLYIVGTPIGNMDDMTYRGVETLKNVDLIAAEDTRNTYKILNHYGITTPMTSYHEHNKKGKGEVLIEKLKDGMDIALVSDAGMPLISDPGDSLVKECIENEIPFTAVPGPTAFVTGLVLSGLIGDDFKFIGFLSVQNTNRFARLNSLVNEKTTLIFYEAPHKLLRILNDLLKIFGDRKIAVCRELTKKFEEVLRGNISDMIEHFSEISIKGEFVLILEGAKEEEKVFNFSISEHLKIAIDNGMSKKEAITFVAKERNIPKKEVYKFSINNETEEE